MSECIHGVCVAHLRDTYWNIQDQEWVHADGWPCRSLIAVAGPPEQTRVRSQ